MTRYVKNYYDEDGEFIRRILFDDSVVRASGRLPGSGSNAPEFPVNIRKALRMNNVKSVEVHLQDGTSYEITVIS
jgi:hypothetical protein